MECLAGGSSEPPVLIGGWGLRIEMQAKARRRFLIEGP